MAKCCSLACCIHQRMPCCVTGNRRDARRSTSLMHEPPFFEQLTADDIAAYVAANFPQRPWTCTLFTGTDGSRIFRGGVGHSLVIDTADGCGARSHEDFRPPGDFTMALARSRR